MESAAQRTEPVWRRRDPVVGYVLALFLSTATLGMAYAVGVTEDTVGAFVGGQIGFWGGLFFSVWLASKVSGSGVLRRDYALRWNGADVLLGFVVGSALQLVVLPLLYLPIGLFVDNTKVAEESRKLIDQPGWTWLLIVGVVLVAPVVEELFFRGLLLGTFLQRVRWPVAVGLSSLIFGITHFQLLQLPGLVCAGIGFAVLRVRTGSLFPAIAAHMAFNGATVLVMYL